MKRSHTAALCAGALLVSMACGAYALTKEDSLISLSYLTDVFSPSVAQQGKEQVKETLGKTYSSAKDTLDDVHGELMHTATGSNGAYSPDLRPRDWNAGDIVAMETGTGIMMYHGAARVNHDGAFIDVTDGVELASGSELVSGHRYLVGEDTIADVVVLSGLARMGVQGNYEKEPGEDAAIPFYDVRTQDWYYEAVGYVYNEGLLTGVGDNRFEPHMTMDRAMLMTTFYRLAGSPEGELAAATASFLDVPESAWYYKFVRWAATQEITAGIGDNQFGPGVQLTREQVVTLLHSFATRYMGQTLDGRTNITGYSDYEKSSQWARDSLSWAVYYGILDSSWAGENTLGGHQYADRAEVSAMLAAFGKNIL